MTGELAVYRQPVQYFAHYLPPSSRSRLLAQFWKRWRANQPQRELERIRKRQQALEWTFTTTNFYLFRVESEMLAEMGDGLSPKSRKEIEDRIERHKLNAVYGRNARFITGDEIWDTPR